MKVGQVVKIAQLNKEFGPHAVGVLDGYLESMPREKSKQRTYKCVKDLPGKTEFFRLRDAKYTKSIADLVGDAFSTFEELAGEVSDWFDNLPQAFQDGEKGDALTTAKDALEGVSAPDVPDSIGERMIVCIPPAKVVSRADRLDEAKDMLQHVVDDLNEAISEAEGNPDEEAEAKLPFDKDEAETLVSDLESAIGDVESVEFPPMFGS